MQPPASTVIEVLTIGEACYAVVVGGVCVMIYSTEADAIAHSERLKQQPLILDYS